MHYYRFMGENLPESWPDTAPYATEGALVSVAEAERCSVSTLLAECEPAPDVIAIVGGNARTELWPVGLYVDQFGDWLRVVWDDTYATRNHASYDRTRSWADSMEWIAPGKIVGGLVAMGRLFCGGDVVERGPVSRLIDAQADAALAGCE